MFYFVVRMRQTVQVSLESVLSQRGVIFSTLYIRVEVLEGNTWEHINQIQQIKKKYMGTYQSNTIN